LRDVVPANEVRMSGTWSAKTQRRYASREQLGTGEGPYRETVDWKWDGLFESVGTFVGIAIVATEHHLYWVKSGPPVAQAPASVSASAWAGTPNSVSFSGAFHAAHPPSVPVEIREEPPKACVIGASQTTTCMPHVTAQLGRAAFAVVLLPASAVKVGRNRLWHVRESIASRLSPELQRLLTRGRSGEIRLMD
jgi:hypothetical protein